MLKNLLDFRGSLGSMMNWANNTKIANGGVPFKVTEKGKGLHFTSTPHVTLTGSDTIGTEDFSFITVIKPTIFADYKGLYSRDAFAVGGIAFYLRAGGLVRMIPEDSSAVDFTPALTLNTFQVIEVQRNGNDAKLYVDGVLKQTVSNAFSGFDFTSTTTEYIGSRDGVYDFSGFINKMKIIQGTLSDDDRTDYVEEFQNLRNIQPAIRGFKYWKPTDLSNEVGTEIGSTEYITDGDFEGGFTGGVGNGWTLSRGNPSEVTGYGGGSAQQITNPTGNTGLLQEATVSTVSGKRYRLTFMAKNVKGSGGEVLNNNNDFSKIDISDSDWTKYSVDFVASANDTRPIFYADTNASDDTNGIAFDDVSVKELFGLVAAYNFDKGSVVDISNNGNNGTKVGNPVASKDGMSFDGVDDCVSIADSGDLSFGDGTSDSPFTIAVRFKNNDVSSNCPIIAKDVDGNHAEYQLLWSSSGKIYFQLFDDTDGHNIYVSTIDLSSYEGEEIDIVAKYDGSGSNAGLSVYVNAVDVSNTRGSLGSYTAMHNSNGTLKIGKRAIFSTTYADCEVIDTRIDNRALSLQEIKDYHNSYAEQKTLVENFEYGADGIVKDIHNWRTVTGTFKINEDTDGRYLECATNGTIETNVDLSTLKENGYIKSLTGDLSADEGDTVDNATNVSYANNKLTLTMTAGQKVYDLVIQQGVTQ